MRHPITLLATVLAATALTGCTTQSQVCKDGVCKISMSGKGASTTLGDGGSSIELLSAGGGEAKLKIGDETGTVKLNQTVELKNGTLTVTEIKDDKVKLRVEEQSSSDAAGDQPTT